MESKKLTKDYQMPLLLKALRLPMINGMGIYSLKMNETLVLNRLPLHSL